MDEWKETEIGRIPEHWGLDTLGGISSLITDGSHRSPDQVNSKFLMPSVKDMTYDKFDFTNCKTISEKDFLELVRSNCSPQKGDIIISKDGANCLDLIFVYNQDEHVVLLSSLAIVRLKENYSPEFLRYYLLSPNAQFLMRNNLISGSAIPRVVLKDFKNVLVPTPDYAEQRAIASVLSSLDAKIDLLHRQNKTLEGMAEALFREWFVEKAEGCEEYVLTDVADHVKDSVDPRKHPTRTYHHYSLPAYDEGRKPSPELGETIKSSKYVVPEYAVLVSKLNPRFPRVWPVRKQKHEHPISSTEFQVFVPKKAETFGFLYCFLSSKAVQDELASAASGTSGSHQRVSPDDIRGLTFHAKSMKQLEDFSVAVDPLLEKIETNKDQVANLVKLRDTLLPKLMSGEVRVEL